MKKRRILWIFGGSLLLIGAYYLGIVSRFEGNESFVETAIVSGNTFYYPFNSSGTLYEAGAMGETTSPYWWVNSGAELAIDNGIGATVQGALPANDPWRILYFRTNPKDTDNGYHPQNIFRLVTRGTWTDYTEEAYFRIDANELSTSDNRNESNGLLLFNRYADGKNLYYAGVRVDGQAVIKKKKGGIYYTMAIRQIFPGFYNVSSSPNLLPQNTWIGLRTIVTNDAGGSVDVKLYDDVGRTGNWKLLLDATDDGRSYGGAALTEAGYLGIRTDFMDVSFDDFRVTGM